MSVVKPIRQSGWEPLNSGNELLKGEISNYKMRMNDFKRKKNTALSQCPVGQKKKKRKGRKTKKKKKVPARI